MRTRTTGLHAATAALAVASCALVLLGGEITFRLIDGYVAWSLALVQRPGQVPSATLAASYAASVPLAPGMRIEWFDRTPEPLGRRDPDPVLVRATSAPQVAAIAPDTARVFNWGYAQRAICEDPRFERFPNFLFAFDAPNGAPAPPYRFARNAVYPDGLITNAYGWRGRPLDFRKPEATIRLAFVGASTTVGGHHYPASYPELVGHWLNLWAAEQNLKARFEIINAGREGIASTHIAAVVRDEVLPMEPDLVIYYEGSNQFSPADIVQAATDRDAPPAAARPPAPAAEPEGARGPAAEYSAIVRRLRELRSRVGEPPKPPYQVTWPADVDEDEPPLAHARLPGNLTTILHDLDDMRRNVTAAGSEFVLSSFFWLVFDGMTLHPVRNQRLYAYLNTTFHPFRYREMERLARFQNRVLAKYARTHAVPFVDVAARMPKAPDLFVDAIHATYDGVRVHAWVVVQQLVPLLQDRIAKGRLPRSPLTRLATHPAFPGNERTVTFDCRLDMNRASLIGHIRFDQGVEAVEPAGVEAASDLTVRLPGGIAPFHYAAMVPAPPVLAAPDGDWILEAEVSVAGGEALIGILAADRQSYLVSKLVGGTEGFVPLKLVFPPAPGGPGPFMVAAGSAVPRDVTIKVRNARLWSLRNPWHVETYAAGLAIPPQRQ